MASSNTGYLASSKPQDQEENNQAGTTLPLADDQSFTDMEMQILWQTLHELRGISSTWEGKAQRSPSPNQSTSGSGSGGSGSGGGSFQNQHYVSSESDDPFQRQTSNDSGGGSNDNSNENSNSQEGSNTGYLAEERPNNHSGGSEHGGDEVPSEGSAVHQEGNCRPCIYACKNKCQAGSQCTFCHYPHDMPKRPGKNARRRAMHRSRQMNGGSPSEGGDAGALTNSPSHA